MNIFKTFLFFVLMILFRSLSLPVISEQLPVTETDGFKIVIVESNISKQRGDRLIA